MSTLNVDALVGNTSANAITVRGEGSATTSLQQGLAKAWLKMDGSGTAEINDSFNNSSITDDGTGQFAITISTAFASANYSTTGSQNLSTSNLAISDFTTTVHKTFIRNDAATFADPDHLSTSNFGDLA
tara:strand:+ start:361 stop:747 length:387 start_codon:yes stop_codon:yes gene_type:complete